MKMPCHLHLSETESRPIRVSSVNSTGSTEQPKAVQDKHDNEWLEASLYFDNVEKLLVLGLGSTNALQEDIDNTAKLIQLQRCPDFKGICNCLLDAALPNDPDCTKTIVHQAKQIWTTFSFIIISHETGNSQLTGNIFFNSPSKKAPTVQQHHGNSGHFGFRKVYAAIQEKYYWPHICQYIVDSIKSCDRCQNEKKDTK